MLAAVVMLTAAAPIVMPAAVSAESVTGYLTFDTDTGTITKCDNSASGELVIPSEIEGVAVTSIGEGAFSYCRSLSIISIPSSVTSIGERAFLGCSSLTSISIPEMFHA